MPIIRGKAKTDKEQFRISIEKNIVAKVRQYCEWAGVGKMDDFFEQAANLVFAKDKDWQAYIGKQN